MPNYKLPKELKKRMERELRQYYYNKKKLDKLKKTIIEEKHNSDDPTGDKTAKLESTRSLIYLEERLQYVENVYNRLRPHEQQIYNWIFKDCCNPIYCEIENGISRSTYYNIFNKCIYYLAEEWGEI